MGGATAAALAAVVMAVEARAAGGVAVAREEVLLAVAREEVLLAVAREEVDPRVMAVEVPLAAARPGTGCPCSTQIGTSPTLGIGYHSSFGIARMHPRDNNQACLRQVPSLRSRVCPNIRIHYRRPDSLDSRRRRQ